MKVLTEAPEQVRFLFTDEVEYDEGSWQKVLAKPDSATAIAAAVERLTDLEVWTTEEIETSLRAMLEELELNARKGLQPLRVAVTGSSISPPLFESLEALGRDRTLARLRDVHGRL